MGQKKQPAAAALGDPKKRRRVGFFAIDAGIEAKDCIKIYLVSSKEELDASSSFCIDPVDLDSFFGEDGKIYGYEGLKINIWVSSISFHAYADITFESKSDGGKGITDLKTDLQNIFAATIVESKEEFLQTFSTQRNFIGSIVSGGQVLQRKTSNGHVASSDSNSVAASNVEVVRMVIGDTEAGPLYGQLIPLVFLLVDGSSPIDVTDPCWELYLLIENKVDHQGEEHSLLLGFAAAYRFYHYPGSSRLRISQIMVLPPYQHKGYGRYLLEVLYGVAVSEDVFDLTIEEPLDYLQHVRTCIDVQRLLTFEPIQQAVNEAASHLKQGKLSKKTQIPRLMPPRSAIEDVQKSLKINKKQFLQCWEVLIYLGLSPVDKYMDDFVAIISNRVREDILGKDSGTTGKQVISVESDYDQEMSFTMIRSQPGEAACTVQLTDESQANQEEQLQKLVDERMKEIKLVAEKVSSHWV
ncbi:hypothetical protein CsatB_020703 [Cannabis sativa]